MIVVRKDDDGYQRSYNITEHDTFELASCNKYVDSEWMVYLNRPSVKDSIPLLEHPVSRDKAQEIFDRLVYTQAAQTDGHVRYAR